jgi:hypothetical protein
MGINLEKYISKAFDSIFSDSLTVEENKEEDIYKISVNTKKLILPITYIKEKEILITENKLAGKIIKLKDNKLSQDQTTEILSLFNTTLNHDTLYIQISRIIEKNETQTYLCILQPFESIEKIIKAKKENFEVNLINEIAKQIGEEIKEDLEIAKIISKYLDLSLTNKKDNENCIEIKDYLNSSIISEDLSNLYTENRIYRNYAPVESFKYTENPLNPDPINEAILKTSEENNIDIKIHNNIITQLKKGEIKSLITITIGTKNHKEMDKLNQTIIQTSRNIKFPLFKYTQQTSMFIETAPANFFEEAFDEKYSNKKRIIKENKETITEKLSKF